MVTKTVALALTLMATEAPLLVSQKERPREALKLALDASAHGFASQAISFLPYCLPNVFIIILLMLFISLISFTTCRFHTQPTNVDLQTKR